MSALVLTNRAVSELADGDNRALRNIQLRTLAVGTGTGAPDKTLVALRTPRQTGALVGTTKQAGRIAVAGHIAANADYNVNEVGLVARLGDTGAEWLFAYWSTADAATPLLRLTNGSTGIIPAVLDLDVDPAAEINVTVSPLLDFGAKLITSLTDVQDALVANRWLKINAAGTKVEFVALPVATAAGDDSENLVSTEWLRDNNVALLDAVLGGSGWREGVGGVGGGVAAKAANYSITAGDDGKILSISASADARTATLPDLGSGAAGYTVTALKSDSSANAVTIHGNGTDTINGAASLELTMPYESAVLKWDGAAWWIIGGSAAARVYETMGLELVDILLARGGALSAKQTATQTTTDIITAYADATREEVAKTLAAAGYTASQTAPALKAAFPATTASQMATALAAAGYTASQTAPALKAAFPATTASQMATALKAAFPAITNETLANAILGVEGYGWTGASTDIERNTWTSPALLPDGEKATEGWIEATSTKGGLANNLQKIHISDLATADDADWWPESVIPHEETGLTWNVSERTMTFSEDISSQDKGVLTISKLVAW